MDKPLFNEDIRLNPESARATRSVTSTNSAPAQQNTPFIVSFVGLAVFSAMLFVTLPSDEEVLRHSPVGETDPCRSSTLSVNRLRSDPPACSQSELREGAWSADALGK